MCRYAPFLQARSHVNTVVHPGLKTALAVALVIRYIQNMSNLGIKIISPKGIDLCPRALLSLINDQYYLLN